MMNMFSIRSAALFMALVLFPAAAKASILPLPVPAVSALAASAARYSPSDSASEVYSESLSRACSPFVRVGFAAPSMIYMMDRDLNYYYNKSWGLMADCFFFKKRSRLGNGLDIGARFTYRNFLIGDDIRDRTSDLLYRENRVHLMSWDISFRGVIGMYFLHELWQLYAVAAPRLLHYHAVMKDNRLGGEDKLVDLVSIGVIGGAGIEVTLVPMMGIFAEYNIGYTPVGKSYNNVEGHQVYVGLTWRTLYPGVVEY
jgi:hypothetical protein